ncbi:YecA family protein [Halalkalibacter lacteus]|uniref:YecA family protein n=1 Tax=Halalkalibacter lacteus TaxID=3090663 RepID=UPI002FC8D010
MDKKSDNKTKDLLIEAVEGAKAHNRQLQSKREQQAWKETNIPCTLFDAISRLTKNDMDQIRKSLRIKNASSLNKSKLAAELVNQIPSLFEDTIYTFDQERYELVRQIIKNEGYISDPNLSFSKIEVLKEYSILFPGKYRNENVLFMPMELMHTFSQVDGFELQKIVRRNTEWTRLIHGLLYYYGIMDSGKMLDKIQQLTGAEVNPIEYFNMLFLTIEYYGQAQYSAYGIHDHRVFDPEHLIEEHNMRSSISNYRFTKKQLVKAGEPNYIEKTPAMNSLLRFISKHFDLTNEESDKIAMQFINMINMDAQPIMMLQYLQSQLEFPSFEFVQEVTDKIMDLHNNTRMWVLKGHTPRELSQVEKKHLNPLPSAPFATNQTNSKVVDIRNHTKTGRNNPCPCGSGKKYKKCCMK